MSVPLDLNERVRDLKCRLRDELGVVADLDEQIILTRWAQTQSWRQLDDWKILSYYGNVECAFFECSIVLRRG